MAGAADLLRTDLLACGGAAAAGLAGTMAMRSLALRLGFANHPNPLIPQHTRPVAYLGGVGVAIGIGAGFAALAALGRTPADRELVAPALLFLALGVVDDRMALRPIHKFALQAAIAALAVALGNAAPITGLPLVDAALSWLWLATLVNAFNFLDVCDGLLASVAAVGFAALAVFDPPGRPALLVVSAACLGFLVLNRPPARIFLGDAGSHLLGFLAGAGTLAAVARAEARPAVALGAAALIMGVPLFELGFLTAVRLRKGLPWWKGSPDHLSLRLQAAGLTRGQTVLIACAFAVAWGLGGLGMVRLRTPGIGVLLAGVGLSAAAAAAYLLRHEVKLAAASPDAAPGPARLPDVAPSPSGAPR